VRNVTVLDTVSVPELSNPRTVTGLADADPAMSTLVMENTPFANSKVDEEDVGTAALGGEDATGVVLLALKLFQTKPWYVVSVLSSAKSSKLITSIRQ
jgi:hypothetical protein